MSRITDIDARREIKRLQNAYSLPREATTEGVSEAWREALDGISASELHDAVSGYLRDGGRYWPTPADIRRLALDGRKDRPTVQASDLRTRYYAWEQTHEGPCPVCSAVMQTVGIERPDGEVVRRYAVIHDRGEHQRQGIPHVGRPYPPMSA